MSDYISKQIDRLDEQWERGVITEKERDEAIDDLIASQDD